MAEDNHSGLPDNARAPSPAKQPDAPIAAPLAAMVIAPLSISAKPGDVLHGQFKVVSGDNAAPFTFEASGKPADIHITPDGGIGGMFFRPASGSFDLTCSDASVPPKSVTVKVAYSIQ